MRQIALLLACVSRTRLFWLTGFSGASARPKRGARRAHCATRPDPRSTVGAEGVQHDSAACSVRPYKNGAEPWCQFLKRIASLPPTTMSTFAKAGFNAASARLVSSPELATHYHADAEYLAARPVYPKALYDNVFSFHRGPTAVALDLGAGSGQGGLPPRTRRRDRWTDCVQSHRCSPSALPTPYTRSTRLRACSRKVGVATCSFTSIAHMALRRKRRVRHEGQDRLHDRLAGRQRPRPVVAERRHR
jgi:hypothetical protein